MRIFVGQGNFTDDTDESYNELSGTWEKVPDSGRGVERCGLPQYDGDRHRTVRPEDQGLFDICGFRRSGHEASVFEVVQFRSGESLVHRIDQRIARDEDHQGRGTEIEGFVADVLPDPYRAVFRRLCPGRYRSASGRRPPCRGRSWRVLRAGRRRWFWRRDSIGGSTL